MKRHVKIYMDYFGYVLDDIVCCEVCGKVGVDIHHLKARGMGGTTREDTIEGLMCLCRDCHVNLGDRKDKMDYLISIHEKHLKNK